MWRSSYSLKDVYRLLGTYPALVAGADTTEAGIRRLIELADLHRALARLSDEYREVVFWVGLVGLPQERAAEVLQKSQSWVSKRYADAVEDVEYWINGGD